MHRDLPQDIDAEMALLGAVMCSRDALDFTRQFIRPESFCLPQHQVVYQAVLDDADAGLPVDVLALANRLKNVTGMDRLNEVGGMDYLVSLVESFADVANHPYYAEVVRGHWQRRLLIGAGNRLQNLAYDPFCEPSELIHRQRIELDEIETNKRDDRPRDLHGVLRKLPEELRHGSGFVPTPIEPLNQEVGGIERGAYTVLAGRPSTGKTAFALACSLSAATNGQPAIIFSLEMRDSRLALRVLASVTDRPMGLLRHNASPDDLRSYVAYTIDRTPPTVWLYDDIFNLRDIVTKAKSMIRTAKVSLVVVDYVQIVHPHGKHATREREVGSISNALKQLAQETGAAVLALAQLNRDVERTTRRPNLADLRDSGSLEQDADCVWLLWCDEKEREKSSCTIVLRVAKNRQGKLTEFLIQFDKPTMTFRSTGVSSNASGERNGRPSSTVATSTPTTTQSVSPSCVTIPEDDIPF